MVDITLALGGGGIKGIAHLGVIEQLEKEGFQVKAIAGTSAGGIVGACLASGHTTQEIQNVLNKVDQSRLFTRHSGDGPSLLGLAGLTEALSNILGEKTFKDLKIPFACTAVDNITGQEIIITNGRLIDAIQATSAFPGIFPPKQIGGKVLVDGGVLDPVPVSLARWLYPGLPVVAVALSPAPEKWAEMPLFNLTSNAPIPTPIIEQVSRLRITQAFNIFARSMDITSCMMGELRLQQEKPDVIIRPDVGKYSVLENINAKILIDLGAKAVIDSKETLATMNRWQNSLFRIIHRPKQPGIIVNFPEK
jgi:NTE family protein